MPTEFTEKYVEVILPLPMDTVFQYRIPPENRIPIYIGQRVEVPFNKRSLVGYIIGLTEKPITTSLRYFYRLIDITPTVSPEFFTLSRWIAKRYICSWGEALAAILPGHLRPTRSAVSILPPPPSLVTPFLPTSEQDYVLRQIGEKMILRQFASFLLYGITDSGKTEVYLQAIANALTLGRQAIFLLPEISLTSQFIDQLRQRFGQRIGIWHSRLSWGERYWVWQAAKEGRIDVVLGVRSAIFVPFHNLGVIVIDEEHEPAYKQDKKPMYHTREIAFQRARWHKTVLILGSATPSLESFYRAQQGEFKLLELTERVSERKLPIIKIVNLCSQEIKKQPSIFSPELVLAVQERLSRHEQVILFINRRGFITFILCRSCGWVFRCPHCSISLVYHFTDNKLRCHYCGFQEDFNQVCPRCQGKFLFSCGGGTQKVELEIKKLFPQARVFRMDIDTATPKNVYTQMYEAFKEEKIDILVGTQMIAKGFDFPKVTLVGVIDADVTLHLPEFRSAERTFQLITHVAGRAGRGDIKGEVIVQTHCPEQYSLLAASKHDYRGFYQQEIALRQTLFYPPFSHLVNIILRGINEEMVNKEAEDFAAWLTTLVGAEEKIKILGPVPAVRYKLANKYRYQVLLKGDWDSLEKLFYPLRQQQYRLGSKVQMSIDVDPQGLL